MSLRVNYEVACDDCLHVEDFNTGGLHDKKELLAMARKAGWKFTRYDGRARHICPHCQKKGGT